MIIPTFGIQELLLVFAIIMVLFGATKLPQLGRGLGEGIRNFKRGLKNDEASDRQLEENQVEEERQGSESS